MFRHVIHVDAIDSPNVIEGREVIPGVVTKEEYEHRLVTWDPVMIEIGLRGRHYKGAELLLYPPQWLNRAAHVAMELIRTRPVRQVRTIGVDPGEGVANTVWTGVDEYGVVFIKSMKTPDTSVIVPETIALIKTHNVEHHNVLFDRGGGGKQRADDMRSMGYDVRTVAFGESLLLDPRRGIRPMSETTENREGRSVYRNRRAQMYGILRELLNPVRELPDMGHPSPYGPITGFGVPMRATSRESVGGNGTVTDPYVELRRQLAKFPLMRDGEGRMELPPKNRRAGEREGHGKCLVEILGCSPDEADSLVLATFGLVEEGQVSIATMY